MSVTNESTLPSATQTGRITGQLPLTANSDVQLKTFTVEQMFGLGYAIKPDVRQNKSVNKSLYLSGVDTASNTKLLIHFSKGLRSRIGVGDVLKKSDFVIYEMTTALDATGKQVPIEETLDREGRPNKPYFLAGNAQETVATLADWED